jgi:hypothetical protein
MGILQLMGGNEVLSQWDGDTETWAIAGHMEGVWRYHAERFILKVTNKLLQPFYRTSIKRSREIKRE